MRNELKIISNEEIIYYDMKNDYLDELIEKTNYFIGKKIENYQTRGTDLSTLEKICIYKVLPSQQLYIDCDVMYRVVSIYSQTMASKEWKICRQKSFYKDIISEKYCLRKYNDKQCLELRGDTMNSYGTTIHAYIREKIVGKYRDEMIKKGILEINSTDTSKWQVAERYRLIYDGKDLEVHWEACILDNYAFFKEHLKDFKLIKFLECVHVIGNFIPAPSAFNVPRYMVTKDYWDLTLLGIYNYFTGKDEKLSFITANKKEMQTTNRNICKVWLDSFGSWSVFIEKTFMQDFVRIEEDGIHYGKPKELWNGHFDPKAKILPEGEQFNELFINVSEWVIARGHRILESIK